jgi:hypothetical protein
MRASFREEGGLSECVEVAARGAEQDTAEGERGRCVDGAWGFELEYRGSVGEAVRVFNSGVVAE